MAELGAITAGTRPTTTVGSRSASRYYVGIGIAFLVVMIWGFTRSFYLRPFFTVHHSLDLSGSEPMPLLVVLHGSVLTAWFALFFAQVWLVGTRRINVHRQLGVATAIVAVLLVVLSVPTIVYAIPRLDHAQIPREITSTVVIGDFLALAWFTLFVATAIGLRRRSDVHKRLMMLACLAIFAPALARVGDMLGYPTLAIVGGTIALWLSLAIYDVVSRKRLHAVTIGGGLLVIVANPLLMAWLVSVSQRHGFVDALACIASGCS